METKRIAYRAKRDIKRGELVFTERDLSLRSSTFRAHAAPPNASGSQTNRCRRVAYPGASECGTIMHSVGLVWKCRSCGSERPREAPHCHGCGAVTVRSGAVFQCLNCGVVVP